MKAHMTEKQFNELFDIDGIETKDSGINDYPVEKSIIVGGVKFFCLSKDFDTWARLKGYVRKEAV